MSRPPPIVIDLLESSLERTEQLLADRRQLGDYSIFNFALPKVELSVIFYMTDATILQLIFDYKNHYDASEWAQQRQDLQLQLPAKYFFTDMLLMKIMYVSRVNIVRDPLERVEIGATLFTRDDRKIFAELTTKLFHEYGSSIETL